MRGRIDWKYALALSLTDPGFDSTVLSEFRSRLVEGGAEQVLLDAVLTLARERNLLSGGGGQRTGSTHVLAAVRALNRLECAIETMRHALESLAVAAPDWLLAHAQPDWAERYGHRALDDRLAKNAARREERARTVGQDRGPGRPRAPGCGARPGSEPKFYLLLQGAKRMTIGSETFICEPGTCAVAAIGLPFTSRVTEASAERPYLGVELKLDPGVVAGLLLDVPDNAERPCRSISIASVDATLVEPLERLIRLLDKPIDLVVLGPQIERELCYRLLQGPMAGTLRQIGRGNTRFGQIRAAAEWIGANADKPMRVDQLAASVGMSLTSFHRHFKAVTAHSPLAYQRRIRLLDARRRLASGAASVTETAFATGYASAPQFSREYKRAFGVSPVRDAASLRQ